MQKCVTATRHGLPRACLASQLAPSCKAAGCMFSAKGACTTQPCDMLASFLLCSLQTAAGPAWRTTSVVKAFAHLASVSGGALCLKSSTGAGLQRVCQHHDAPVLPAMTWLCNAGCLTTGETCCSDSDCCPDNFLVNQPVCSSTTRKCRGFMPGTA